MQVNDTGQLNLIDIWANREYDDAFDPTHFFADRGVVRFVQYLEVCLEQPVVTVEKDDQQVWVHPLVIYKYLAWCEPQVAALSMDLYHGFTRDKVAAGIEINRDDITRH